MSRGSRWHSPGECCRPCDPAIAWGQEGVRIFTCSSLTIKEIYFFPHNHLSQILQRPQDASFTHCRPWSPPHQSQLPCLCLASSQPQPCFVMRMSFLPPVLLSLRSRFSAIRGGSPHLCSPAAVDPCSIHISPVLPGTSLGTTGFPKPCFGNREEQDKEVKARRPLIDGGPVRASAFPSPQPWVPLSFLLTEAPQHLQGLLLKNMFLPPSHCPQRRGERRQIIT